MHTYILGGPEFVCYEYFKKNDFRLVNDCIKILN